MDELEFSVTSGTLQHLNGDWGLICFRTSHPKTFIDPVHLHLPNGIPLGGFRGAVTGADFGS